MRATSLGDDSLTRIQSGFFGVSTVGMILIGIRATLSWPRSFSPTSGRFGLSRTMGLSVCGVEGAKVCTVSVIAMINP